MIFFDKLKSTCSGRYPNEVRASLQAVTAAITSKEAPPGMLSFIARLTGASRFQMALASKKWDSWLEDSSRSLIELRGQVRSDKMPEAWVKHCTEVWVHNIRPSELKSDCISNPNDRSDDAVYHTYYLEM